MQMTATGGSLINPAAKVMFEIYREAGYGQQYRVVYFTELDEHNKETEISRAMAGEHLFDGFLVESRLSEAKSAIAGFLKRLNNGEDVTADELQRSLRERNLMAD